MSYECFDVESKGKVAHVVLKRGDELNTMTPAFWRELPAIVDDIDRRGEARALVISSTGKHFSAGMDLSVFTGGASAGAGASGEVGRQRANFRRGVLRLQQSFSCLEQARLPVLAAVQGGCIGGAVDMVTACDMRYATADAFFCIQEINIGMTADVGTLQRLPKIIPEGLAREWAYTGDRVPAERARQAGLVNEVFDDHESLVDGVLERFSTLVDEDIAVLERAPEGAVAYYVRSSVAVGSPLDRAAVAATRLAQAGHEAAARTIRSVRQRWLAAVRRHVPDPTVALAITLIGDGLYYDSALHGQDPELGVDAPPPAELDALVALLERLAAG